MSTSIATSRDTKSNRPTKRARGPTTAIGDQSLAVNALFKKQLNREIYIPTSATTGPKTASQLAPPPEIVANVQGSSAGAGSGEFHVYKASRRREYERVRLMEEESKREEADKAWQQKSEENRRKDDEKTTKNAKKRAKLKARKERAKAGSSNDTKAETAPLDLGAGQPSRAQLQHDEDDEKDNVRIVTEEAAPNGRTLVIHDEDD